MRGRYPLRLEQAVQDLDASAVAKERLQVLVATLTGQCRFQEACAQLCISEPRLQQLRQQFLEGALASLEPRRAGRPARVPTEAEQRVQQLEAELAALRLDHQAALLRAEINAVLPHVGQTTPSEKKNAPEAEETARPARWSADEHLKQLGLFTARGHDGASTGAGPRGPGRQQQQRQREQQVRSHVVEFTNQARAEGCPMASLAELLGLPDRTLRSWRERLELRPQTITLRGRPTRRAPLSVRQELLEVLQETGPGLSVATLREHFPEMGRRELEDFLARYRRVWRCRHTTWACELSWLVFGSVWAMDFTKAPVAIDGLYPYVLAVRDLASGQQLLAWPMADCGTVGVLTALQWLFRSQGVPLVLKTDNGSAFRAGLTQSLLRHWGVTVLFSPARTPWYNGAIEAGIGSLKMRAERGATHRGHAGIWTGETVEAARQEANTTARPQGLGGQTPEQAWAQRRPLEPEERQHFQATVEVCRKELFAPTTGAGSGVKPGTDWESLWTQRDFAGEDRQAVSRALQTCGYLLVSRRRIHLPIPGPKTANYS